MIIPQSEIFLKKAKKRDKYLDLARETKKPGKHESDGDTCWNWWVQNSPEKFGKGAGRVEEWEGESRPSKIQHC